MAKLTTEDKIDSNPEVLSDSVLKFNGSTTSSQSVAELLSSLVSNNQNVLDSYDNVTYHFKFSYVVQGKEIILVESGKTDLYIDSCSIKTSIGMNFTVRNITSAQFNLVIRESQGTSFFDKLFYIQKQFNQDFKLSEYAITLTFNGYDSFGNPAMNIGGTFKWSVILSSVNYNIDVFGTVYNIDLISKSETAFSDDIGTIQQGGGFSLPDSGSLKEILSSLKDSLNEQNKNNNNGIQTITYDFKDVPYSTLGVQLPIQISSPFDMKISNAAMANALENSSRNDDVVQHTKGVQISKYIDSLMSNSLEANGLLVNKANPDWNVLGDVNDTTYAIVHRIVAKVEYTIFDPNINGFKKNVTYSIVPRISVIPILSTRQINSGKDYSQKLAVKQFKELCGNGILNKKYDYIFTGNNTNVLNLDISGNMAYAIDFPKMLGARASTDSITPGQVASDQMTADVNYNQDYFADEATLSQFNDNVATNGKINITNDLGYTSELNTIAAQNSTPTTGTYASSIISSTPYTIGSGSATNLLTWAETDNANNYWQNRVDAENATQTSNIRKSLSEKVSTLTASSNYIDDIYNSNSSDVRLMIPINITAAQNSFSYTGSVEQNANNTSSIYSTIMNQVYSSGTDTLQELNMKIRFDPYWIGGLPSSNKVFDLSYDIEQYNAVDQSDRCIILDYNVPVTTSDYNQVVLKRNDIVSGIFMIHTVTHTFGDGQMSQTLSGSRLPLSSLSSIISSGE